LPSNSALFVVRAEMPMTSNAAYVDLTTIKNPMNTYHVLFDH
jgi:hypothetical protein